MDVTYTFHFHSCGSALEVIGRKLWMDLNCKEWDMCDHAIFFTLYVNVLFDCSERNRFYIVGQMLYNGLKMNENKWFFPIRTRTFSVFPPYIENVQTEIATIFQK